jgi:DNA-binding NtrC family response regulator
LAVSVERTDERIPWPLTEHPLTSVPVAYSLLIVSRDPAIRKLLCKLLTHPGYHTHQLAEMSQVAFELRSRKVDVLITDLDFPEQEDLETVTSLAALYPSLKVILLSALAAEQMPGSRVLPKPFRRELLLESVQNALAGRSRATRMPVTTSI